MENAAILARMFVGDGRSNSEAKSGVWGYVKWGLEACWKDHQVNGQRDGGEKAGRYIHLGDVDWLLMVNSNEVSLVVFATS